jgi:tRNA-dihydrouridine synthase A
MLPYIEAHLAAGGRLNQVTRHMLGAFRGPPGRAGLEARPVGGRPSRRRGAGLVERALSEVTLRAA